MLQRVLAKKELRKSLRGRRWPRKWCIICSPSLVPSQAATDRAAPWAEDLPLWPLETHQPLWRLGSVTASLPGGKWYSLFSPGVGWWCEVVMGMVVGGSRRGAWHITVHCSTVKSRLAGWLFPRRKCREESHSCMAIKSCLVGLPLRQESSWLQSSGGEREGEEAEISCSTQHWCAQLCRNFPVASVLKTAGFGEPV